MDGVVATATIAATTSVQPKVTEKYQLALDSETRRSEKSVLRLTATLRVQSSQGLSALPARA
jgi:hypothetical protein